MMSIFSMFSDGDRSRIIIQLAVKVFVVLCLLPVHEYAHALVATKLGDKTAKLSGRLTLSPFAHLDVFGSIMILLFGVGYAKPVPINPDNFKNPKRGMAITAAAGPISNIIMALIFLLFYNGFVTFGASLYLQNELLYSIIGIFLYYAANINITLAVFNLLPVPPLDGSRIFWALLPDKYYFKVMQYERYIMIGLFVLLLTGVLSVPISYLSKLLINALNFIASLPFKAFV